MPLDPPEPEPLEPPEPEPLDPPEPELSEPPEPELTERVRDEYGVNTDKLKRVPQHPEQVGKLGYEVPNER